MQIILGEVNEVNQFRINDIKKEYYAQYIKEHISYSSFFAWAKVLSRPIMGGRFLAIIRDNNSKIKDLNTFVKRLEDIEKSHPYLDIVWMPPRFVKFSNIALKVPIINLGSLFKDDFQSRVFNDLPALSSDGYKEIIKRIGYNWSTYLLYRDKLKQVMASTASDIKKIIKEDRVKPAADILIMVINRSRFAEHNYYRLCRKYSEKWVKQHFSDELDKIIDVKLKLIKNEISLYKIHSMKGMGKYFNVILNTPISHVFLLRTCIKEPNGIDLYAKSSSLGLLNYFEECFVKGVDKKYGKWVI